MALRGVRIFKIALAYASQKWDLDKLEPKHSGTTIDDVVDFVRRKMYMELVQSKEKDTVTDSELESEEVETDTIPGSGILADNETNDLKKWRIITAMKISPRMRLTCPKITCFRHFLFSYCGVHLFP